MAGDVGRVGGARLAGGAEGPLRDPPVLGAREDRAPVLELVDVAGRLVAEDLDRVLVAEVVRALDRVEARASRDSSSEALPRAALIPPSAAPEWLRTGWILEMSATSAPASCASMAARIPAQPAPTTSTSCFASTRNGRYRNDDRLRLLTDAATVGTGAGREILMMQVCSESIGTGSAPGLRARSPRPRVASRRRAPVRAAQWAPRFDRVDPGLVTAVAVLIGLWLVAKDWRDLVPSRRDTAHWRLGLHAHPRRCAWCAERIRCRSWPRSGPRWRAS